MSDFRENIIENRTEKDVREKILHLAASYTPEWIPDMDNPDAGSTLAMIYADQVAENLQRIDHIIDKYHTEFVNLLDISVRPSKAAQSIVVMNLAQDTVEGSYVKKGTKLLSGESIFETEDSVYITSSAMPFMFMTRAKNGRIIPIRGFEDIEDREEFMMFAEEEGIGYNALFIGHSKVLSSDNSDIYIRFEESDRLIETIATNEREGRRQFCYLLNGEFVPFDEVIWLSEQSAFRLRRGEISDKVSEDDTEEAEGIVALVDREDVLKDVYASKLFLSSSGEEKNPQFVGNSITEFTPNSFRPFTENLSMYSECFIGCPDYFAKAGAIIDLSFDMHFEDYEVKLTAEEEEAELKVIKRKPRNIPASVPADVYADIISVEYYNGVGWKRLETTQEMRFIFSESNATDIAKKLNFSFVCPDDWETTSAGPYNGRAIRIMITRSDNCYMRPAVHHYPVIENLLVSYSYENQYVKPERLLIHYGTKEEDVTKKVQSGEKFPVFKTTGYREDALYIGLSKSLKTGPVSIFVEIEENKRFEALSCMWQYSTRGGFRNLKVIDGTDNFSKSGIIVFQPPSDMHEMEFEGMRSCYLRVVHTDVPTEKTASDLFPVVRQICFNGVRVSNIDTRMEEDLFIDEIRPGYTFSLNNPDIFDALVWVNEIDNLSVFAMNDMLKRSPDIVRAEYDIQGRISAFFVLYREVERLDSSDDKRVYELDRLTGDLIFGDGIHTEIPRCTTGVAVRVGIRTCDGARANVDRFTIDSPMSNLMFVGDITNPVKAYGGTNIESVEAAMIRGANLISGRRRLVSKKDYINEITSYSELIDQVSCVPSYDGTGRKKEGVISFILLLKDFMNGSFSYHKIKDELKSHLLNRCEITVGENELFIVEPIFVELSVIAWVKAEDIEDSFEVQSNIIERLNEYLSPLKNERACHLGENGGGWKIGTIPTVSQLQMKLGFFKRNASIRNMAIVARYRDADGYHEMDLNDLSVNPFMVVKPGNHEIHVEL